MGIKIVRTPSETPNITNVDDIIPFRYAYGNQNGYVIGRGSQLDGSYESGEFTVGSGRAVIQGVEVDIDANGISTTLDTASETRYFKIYLKVNLANDVAVLESHYSTVSYDEITDPTSGDLISGGDAYLLLYTLQLSGTTQVELNKIVSSISYGEIKKLLWSGEKTIGSGLSTIADIQDAKNKILEVTIEYTGDILHPNSTQKSYKIYRFKSYAEWTNFVWFSANGQLDVDTIYLTCSFDANKLNCQVDYYHWNINGTSSTTRPNAKAISVYEIIE